MSNPPNYAGKVRRSQIITTYGPGGIINLRAPGGAPISAVTGGLESWDKSAKPPGLRNRQRCFLSRLERKLGVDGFRLPPVSTTNIFSKTDWWTAIAARRLPNWLTCPNCNALKPARSWQRHNEKPDPARWCGNCSSSEKIFAVPVRFIMACSNGHLDEFPWVWWLKNRGRASTEKNFNYKYSEAECSHHSLHFRQGTSHALSSLKLYCKDCGRWAGLGSIFSESAFNGFSCNGKRPWLIDDAVQPCALTPSAVQRNSSSLYLPKFESALDIPPWTQTLQNLLGDWWPRLNKFSTAETRLHNLKVNVDTINEECGTEYTAEILNNEIEALKKLDENSDSDLRIDEYTQFMNAEKDGASYPDFLAKMQDVPKGINTLVERVIAVERLREVRALYGFSRLKESNPICDISEDKLRWLPAIEVRGEGIFINLSSEYLRDWATNEVVQNRISSISKAYANHIKHRGIPEESQVKLSPIFIVIHTLSHLLIRQISYECGYSMASLSERLYAHDGMTGLLIYTSTTDSEGTLGGLSRLARPDRFKSIFIKALESANWCSSDPLCIEGVTSHSEVLNLAACHACLLLPETSCEHLNYFLDRALITGIEEESLPFFYRTIHEAD